MPSDFFTWTSFGSLVGLSAITYVVTNTARVAFNFNPRWFGLVVAIVATEIGIYMTHPTDVMSYVLGILNGCLVFLTAAGGAAAVDAARATRFGFRARGVDGNAKPSFFSSWF